MSLSTSQPPGIFENGGNHVKPFLTALAVFAASVLLIVAVSGLP